jgi:transcriptional regulator with XRE-family HTH domain
MRVCPRRTEIAQLRKDSGLLQKEFASMAGISLTHLQKVELGKREASKRIEDLARGLKK